VVSDVRGLDLQEGHSESLAAGAGDGSAGEGRMIQNCAECMANLWRWNRKKRAYECQNCGHLDR
jgi:hypothetical protein